MGSEVESHLIHIFEMRDGKIARETACEMWRDVSSGSKAAAAATAVAAVQPAEPAPERIIQLGLGFWGPKILLSAVELGVFSELAKGALAGDTLASRLGLQRGGF